MPSHLEGLLELDAALAEVARIVKPLADFEDVSLENALGRYAAAALTAPCNLPRFDNTGVDGYAVLHAQASTQKSLNVIGESLAGQPFGKDLPEKSALHIATGAVLPPGADTVVMQEYCRVENGRLFIETLPEKSANIRLAGNDVKKDQAIFAVGHRLRAQDIAFLNALGFSSMKVRREIKVAIASTGHELLATGAAPALGQIIDSNGLMLKQMLAGLPVSVTLLPALPDDLDKTTNALKQAAATHDVIITTGGVSVGKRDVVKDAVSALGKIHFHKLAIRPGRPLVFGQIENSYFVGLPGNPVSAFVTFFLMVQPLLNALNGGKAALPPAFPLPLGEDLKKPLRLRDFQRAKLETRDGMLCVVPYRDQSSNLLSSLSASDGLIDLPMGADALSKGDAVLFRPYTGLQA